MPLVLPVDFNKLRVALVREVAKVSGLPNSRVLEAEPETQNVPRPTLPYFTVKITTPAAKVGDDSKDYDPNTGLWNSGGNRQMTVAVNCYANSHEEAYNYGTLVQTSFDLEDIQQDLRMAGMAVLTIGSVADLSLLLNTGTEGRSQFELHLGIAVNLQSDLGSMDSVTVQGSIDTDHVSPVTTTVTVTKP